MAKYDVKSGTSRKKKTKSKLKYVIISMLLILLGVVIYLLLTLPLFALKQVEVSGFEEYNSDVIMQSYGFEYGSNVFVDYFKLNKNKVENLSYIKNISVSISFPNKLVIKIVPKSSSYIAYSKDTNKYYLLDEQGFILKEVALEEKKEEIIVLGITFDDVITIGTKINDIDYDKIVIFTKIKEEYDKVVNIGNITKVNFENSLTIITINDKLNIVLPGDKELSYNMKFLKGITQKLEENPIGTIDMTKANPSFSAY